MIVIACIGFVLFILCLGFLIGAGWVVAVSPDCPHRENDPHGDGC